MRSSTTAVRRQPQTTTRSSMHGDWAPGTRSWLSFAYADSMVGTAVASATTSGQASWSPCHGGRPSTVCGTPCGHAANRDEGVPPGRTIDRQAQHAHHKYPLKPTVDLGFDEYGQVVRRGWLLRVHALVTW